MSGTADQKPLRLVFEPKVRQLPGTQLPDNYTVSSAGVPPPDFVVSRYDDGTIASVYSDDQWVWSPYCPSGKIRLLRFDSWCPEKPDKAHRKIINEMRWLMFAIIWLRDGHPYSFVTLAAYLLILNKLALFVERDKRTIRSVLNDTVQLGRFLNKTGNCYAVSLSGLLAMMRNLGDEKVGFSVISKRRQSLVDKRRLQYRSQFQQCPPIPTRIFSAILRNLDRELSDFERIADQYLSLVLACSADPLLGRSRYRQSTLRKRNPKLRTNAGGKWNPDFTELLDTHGLRNYFVSKRLQLTVKGAIKGLTRIQFSAVMLIHAYSGMRCREVHGLPFHCTETFVSGGITHHLIAGYTTKLNHGRNKNTRWVTCREGLRAIQIAQRVAKTVYRYKGVRPTKSKSNHFPLFVSVSYLGLTGYKVKTDCDRHLPGGLATMGSARFRDGFVTTIEEEDLEELEQVDPHRCWRNEKAFELGAPWKLTTHQFRRSLALYASRSGIVSLPSLRRQLQHITEEMTLYYAKGSAFANGIITDREHFGQMYQKTQPESESLAYIKDMLLSDERLFGAHGAWLDRHKQIETLTITVLDRETTRRKAERGEIAHKETLLGGCAEPGPCNKKALRSIVGCLNCARASIKLSKLSRVIAAQESLVKDFDPFTVEWRTENEDLRVLITARNKFIKQGG